MFKNNLRFHREYLKLTQKEVADKLHISRERYNQYENGRRRPDFEILKDIAKIFNVSTDELLDNEEPNPDTRKAEERKQLSEEQEKALKKLGVQGINYIGELSDKEVQAILNFAKQLKESNEEK